MTDDRNIIIKKSDKGSCIVIWGRNDYLTEAEKQLGDKKFYQELSNSENNLSKLAEMSNKMFSILQKRDYITEKQLRGVILQKNNLNIFPINIEKPQTLVNFISFPKFIKDCIMSQDNLLFQIAVHPQKNAWNF